MPVLDLSANDHRFLIEEIIKPGGLQFEQNSDVPLKYFNPHQSLISFIYLNKRILKGRYEIEPKTLLSNYLNLWIDSNNKEIEVLQAGETVSNYFLYKLSVIAKVLNHSKIEFKGFCFEKYL